MEDKLLLTVEAVIKLLSVEEGEFWADLPIKKRDMISSIVAKSIKAQLTKDRERFTPSIEAQKLQIRIAKREERERIALAIDCLPMYKQFREQYGNRPKDIVYSVALNLAKEQALKEGEK